MEGRYLGFECNIKYSALYNIGGGVMSLRVPTSLRLWTICVSRDMTSGTRRDAQGRSSKKGGKMISTTH